MAYTYSGDPAASDLDQYRFLIGDTGSIVVATDATPTDATPVDDYVPVDNFGPFQDPPILSDFILSDEEIGFILNTYTSHNARLYYLFNSCANVLSRQIKRSLGPQSEDPTSRTNHYIEQAKLYRKLMTTSGISLPTYSTDKIFTKGMHDNV